MEHRGVWVNGYGVTLLIDEVLATDELVEQVRVLAEAHVGSLALVPGDLESHLLLDAVDAAQELSRIARIVMIVSLHRLQFFIYRDDESIVFSSSYHEENLLARHRLAAFGNGDGLELLELCQKIAHLIFLF